MPQTFVLPRQTALDDDANPLAGALLYFFRTSTTDLQAIYVDAALTVQHSNPVPANSSGEFPKIYLNPSAAYDYRVRLTTSTGVQLYQEDDISRFAVGTNEIIAAIDAGGDAASNELLDLIDQSRLGHFGENASPGATDMSVTLQAAVDAATDVYAEVHICDDIGINTPIMITSASQQNVGIVGNGRTSTILRPLRANLSTSPVSINAMLINQKDNGHLHLSKFRILDSTVYVGKFLYAIDGGGSDGSCQAMFSAVVDDCWFSLSSNNTGIFQGGFSNLCVSRCVFEGTKDACFILQGAGNGDLQFIGNVMNFCYDSFIRQEDDGQIVNLLLVDGLHVYQHLRGRIIDLTEAYNTNINDVQVEFSSSNVGDCGLIRLKDCQGVRVTNCSMTTDSGTPRGDVGIDIVNSNTAYFENVKITADIGLRVQGTGTIDLTFVNCDFLECQHAFQQLSGSLAGQIRFINCRLNNSDEYGMLHQAGTPSFNIYVQGGEIINAGMGGITTSRNINIDTSGEVRFVGTRLGQDNGSASAVCFVRADGSGLFRLTECPIVGSAPTSIVDASSTQAVQIVWERTTATRTFQLGAAATTVVADTEVHANCHIDIMPTNAAAATLMSGSKSLYVSARNAGTSFTVATADGTAAGGTENFTYRIQP